MSNCVLTSLPFPKPGLNLRVKQSPGSPQALNLLYCWVEDQAVSEQGWYGLGASSLLINDTTGAWDRVDPPEQTHL